MKPEKWISALVGMLLAFLLSFGGMGCLVSAFEMNMSLPALGLSCALAALCGGCYLLKRGDAIIACAGALVLGYLWRRGTLVSSFETMAYIISVRYDGGYGWGTLGALRGTVTAAAMLSGALIALTTVRTVCRRDTAFSALSLSLIPLLLCMVVTDTVPDGRYLAMLLMGMLLLLLTGSLRRMDPGQANTLTAMAAIPVALVVGLLFWMAPKESYVNKTEDIQDTLILWASGIPQVWENLTANEEVMAENDDRLQRVNLSNQGPRTLFTYAVMDVHSETGGTLYLREQDYDSYSGTGWSNSLGRSEPFLRNPGIDWEDAGTVTITTKRVRDVLYYPYYAAEDLTLVGGCIGNTEELTTYQIGQYTLPDQWRQLVSGGDGGDAVIQFPVAGGNAMDLQRYSRLPSDTRKWAEPLVETILTDAQTATEKADAIASYVRNSAEYSLDTQRMPASAEEFTQWFLEESDTGYCVHFATAAAVLLRAAGVESRYVTGYMVFLKPGETVTVTAERAHAWVEYYEPRLDTWIILEATPAMAGNIGDITDNPDESRPDSSGPEDTQPVTDPEDTGETAETEETTEVPADGDVPGDDTGSGERTRGGWWWLAVLIPLGLTAQWSIRRELRRGRLRRGNTNRRALALWQEAALLGRLLKHRPPAELEALAQKAKFSQHTLTTQEVMVFESWLRDAGRQLKSKPWYLRLLWKCLYAI